MRGLVVTAVAAFSCGALGACKSEADAEAKRAAAASAKSAWLREIAKDPSEGVPPDRAKCQAARDRLKELGVEYQRMGQALATNPASSSVEVERLMDELDRYCR